jgi:SAM-dependent methyltransferase
VIEPVLTGERTWPDVPQETYWFMRHLACYLWAAEQVGAEEVAADPRGAGSVLDAGSGEGYGAAQIARGSGIPVGASRVIAVEFDEATISHSRSRYPNVDHVQANLVALPFADCSFRAAVSLQVIEHIWDPLAYLSELDRCTSGSIVISTPNRPVHSPDIARGESPANPFHVREYDAQELRELLLEATPQRTVELYGLRHGVRIVEWEESNGGLPDALLAGDRQAESFAHDLERDDFVIAPLQADDDGRVHDLVALW